MEKEILLLEDEKILHTIKGNAYTASANPLIKLLTFFIKIIWIILGFRYKVYIFVTNKRIIQAYKKSILWGFIPKDTSIMTLNKNTIQCVGYSKAVRWFFFKTIYFSITNISGGLNIVYDGTMQELNNTILLINKFVSE